MADNLCSLGYMYEALVCTCLSMDMRKFSLSVCVCACGMCVIAWVSSVRFRQCLSVGIVGLTALSRHKVLYAAKKLFSLLETPQTDCPDLIEASRPWRETVRRDILATFCASSL